MGAPTEPDYGLAANRINTDFGTRSESISHHGNHSSAGVGKHQNGQSVIAEPLIEDYQQVHYPEEPPEPTVQEQSPPRNMKRLSAHEPLGSHPPQLHSDKEEDSAPPPPDFTRRGIHIPTRTSSSSATLASIANNFKRRSLRLSSVPSLPMPGTSDSGSQNARSVRSDADSVMSCETSASSVQLPSLPPLQHKATSDEADRLSPLLEDDPGCFDLVAPQVGEVEGFSLESRSELIFSKEHLQAIFDDTPSLLKFTSFLSIARPKSVPILIYYLDALKALRAVNYANAVAEALEPIEGLAFTETPARPTINTVLEDKARQAFDVLVREDLPAFVCQTWIQVVSVSIQKRVTGTLPPMLREASEGLAEVFCLSDPSRQDNPIIFASEEFHRTTQYGVNYAIGRNCRFLQGPRTNRDSVARLKKAISEKRETSEVFLNYRRDGSPFMNLLMMAPLLDSRGNMRYFIGAQVDVSGLVKDCTNLDALQRHLAVQEGLEMGEEPKDEFQELSEMLNNSELETVRRHGGNMHKEHLDDQSDAMSMREQRRPRVLLKDMSAAYGQLMKPETGDLKAEGRLSGVYKHYLLIRPAPSLRILFVSPSLRVPGILQSRFLDRIGGSNRVRNSLAEALADGSRGVTAKIRWLSSATADLDEYRMEEGRPRWIHCTPLLGQSGAVGVWMVVLVDDDNSATPNRRFRPAPPVASDLRRPSGQTSAAGGATRNASIDTAHLASDHDSDFDTPRSGSRAQNHNQHSLGSSLQNGNTNTTNNNNHITNQYAPCHIPPPKSLRRHQSSQDFRNDAQRAVHTNPPPPRPPPPPKSSPKLYSRPQTQQSLRSYSPASNYYVAAVNGRKISEPSINSFAL